jgi:hypothetical protein
VTDHLKAAQVADAYSSETEAVSKFESVKMFAPAEVIIFLG